MSKTLKIFNISAVAILAIFACAYLYTIGTKDALGSVPQGSDYIATTTGEATNYGNTITGSHLIRTGSGSLGSIVITGANTGIVNIYDATTTDITKRAAALSTSTILRASFPASTVAGTYVLDATFTNGLYVDLVTGKMPTTTITYRP